jgi:hypothetical protein
MSSLTVPELSLLKLVGSLTEGLKANEIRHVPKPVLLVKRTQLSIVSESWNLP